MSAFSLPTLLLILTPVLYPTLLPSQLPSDRLNRDEKTNKFVYLKVAFANFYTEEKIVMVSFQSGYIFIQTDKPIYNPGDTGEG